MILIFDTFGRRFVRNIRFAIEFNSSNTEQQHRTTPIAIRTKAATEQVHVQNKIEEGDRLRQRSKVWLNSVNKVWLNSVEKMFAVPLNMQFVSIIL